MVHQLPGIPHPTDDTLENYSFSRLSLDETVVFEEHLLICTFCQDRLAETDEYIQLMKVATRQYPMSASAPSASSPWTWKRQMAFGVPVMAMLIFTGLSSWHSLRRLPPAVAVTLEAMRGGGDAAVVHAPARTPLSLSLDTSGLASAGPYRLEVVDSAGSSRWQGAAVDARGELSAVLASGFEPGTYWVRLYSVQGQLMREFGLSLD